SHVSVRVSKNPYRHVSDLALFIDNMQRKDIDAFFARSVLISLSQESSSLFAVSPSLTGWKEQLASYQTSDGSFGYFPYDAYVEPHVQAYMAIAMDHARKS